MTTPEKLAELFHDTYEALAPQFGYETRSDTKSFDPESANGRLMVAVCDRILTALRAPGGWRELRTDDPEPWKPVLAWCVSEDDWQDAQDEDEDGGAVEHQWLVASLSDIQPGFWWQGGALKRVHDVKGWLPLPPTQETGNG